GVHRGDRARDPGPLPRLAAAAWGARRGRIPVRRGRDRDPVADPDRRRVRRRGGLRRRDGGRDARARRLPGRRRRRRPCRPARSAAAPLRRARGEGDPGVPACRVGVFPYDRAVARSWAELLGEADAAPEPEEQRGRFFSRLRDSLAKSRRALTGELAAAAFDPGNEADWERLEEALIMGDVGVRATAELVRRLEARGDLTDLNAALAEEVAALFGEPPTLEVGHEPAVILVVGVNGTGKTTTIGKLAAK